MPLPQPNGELNEKLKNQVLQWLITPVGENSMVAIPVPLKVIGGGGVEVRGGVGRDSGRITGQEDGCRCGDWGRRSNGGRGKGICCSGC